MQTIEAAKDRHLRQSNLITASRYEFGVVEKRIIYLIIQMLNGIDDEAVIQATEGEGLKLTINYRPVLQVCELWSNSPNKNYKYIKDAVDSLIGRKYSIDGAIEEDGIKRQVKDTFVLVAQSRVYLDEAKTLVKIFVPKMALKYFKDLSKNYTTFNMFNAMTLQSQYSQRMYEHCSRWKDTKWFTLSLEKLVEYLNIPDGYSISMIKKRILDTAKKELYSKTELSFSYRERKEGKRIVAFEFTVFFNAKKDKELSTPTPPEAVVELILCKVEGLPLTQWQKQKIATSGKITEAEAAKLLHEYQTNKNTLKNPTGWLISALETKFGITFKKQQP